MRSHFHCVLRSSVLLAASFPTVVSAAHASTPDGSGPSWQPLAMQAIEASEYHVTWQGTTLLGDGHGALQAANRAQNLRTYFTVDGIRLVPRVPAPERGKAWTFGLALTGWGRGDAIDAAAAVAPRVNGDRVEYVRGAITEWYVNDARGLEQGFTIADAGPTNEPLRVEMRVTGTLQARLAAGGETVDLVTARGEITLQLDGLHTFDATGRALPSRFEATGSTLAIEVDDRGAVYPIEIDPMVKSPSWSLVGPQFVANFGYSVDGAGDVNGDGFDDVIIGAPYFDSGLLDAGRAFIFYGSSLGLGVEPNWTATGSQALANLGLSVAGAGDVNGDGFDDVIVGVPQFDNGQLNEGAAMAYYGSANGPSTAPNWTGEGNHASAYAGLSVDGAGDVNGDGFGDVIVGAARFDNGHTDEGRALVYLGSSAGLGTVAVWTAEPNVVGAHFGSSVAGAGDVNGDGNDDVIVGAPELAGGQTDEGRAYLYLGTPMGVSPIASWTAESNQPGARYGNAVAGAGDVNGDGLDDIIVGAYLYDAPQTDEGRVYVYYGAIGGPNPGASWTAESDQPGANLGTSVSSAGDINGDGFADVVAGAFGYDEGSLINAGRVYAFEGSPIGPGFQPAWFANGDQSGAFLGTSVASAGDVNGDGASDVIVGAPYVNGPSGDEGAAYLFLGNPPPMLGDLDGDGTVGAADLGILLGAWGQWGVPADLNGDGFVDPADLGLLLGAWTN